MPGRRPTASGGEGRRGEPFDDPPIAPMDPSDPEGPADGDALMDLLYREYARPLTAVTARLTGGDRQWAEDVVQETMLRAWRNADRLDHRGSLLPWLITVAKRAVIDDHRSRSARPQETDGQLAESARPVVDGTDELVRSMVVGEALETLSPVHRQAVVETYFKDRTAKEAADRLGLPVGTVKSRVHYALRSLRATFKERGIHA
ncbi:sigma-70 family RNA polymerase sigma factor [Nocardiopsis ansamitocini]|uniref:RNA polymerase sigma factor n=1 Tax=Nocardiopsis ansamitocini TaxID=1670832 RepID=A0A9W6P4P2_9ACTN|nr:sigma-70 family RNA polymerase sigma factor [Nocardiopsis ansamitocini]GLU46958.1 RNA polymerase sigma factor [Nocardiopsis ansamitocini]